MSLLVCLSVILGCILTVQCDNGSTEYADRFIEGLRAANITVNTTVSDTTTETFGVKYECELPTVNPPKSVHDLSPGYVEVVAALGDSVTAAFGAKSSTIIDTREFRGVSWSIGGDQNLESVATLPNVLRHFNPAIAGFSTGIGNENPELNVAPSGARTRDLLEQAQNLVKIMEEKELTNGWKVITVWIGGNDLCDITNNPDETPEMLAATYVDNVKKALDYLQANVKMAYINLVLMIDIAELAEVKGLLCGIVHEFSCNSIRNDETRRKATETVLVFNEYLKELIDGGNSYDTDDFTVITQPFFSLTKVPRLSDGNADKSYFAPDCFHFSQKGHGVGSIYLWNNMFEPIGEKTDTIDWDNQQTYKCPTAEYPYFTTYKQNSGRDALRSKRPSSSSQPTSPLTATLVGCGVGVAVVLLAMVVLVGMVRARKRRGQVRGSEEKNRLLKDTNVTYCYNDSFDYN